MNPKHVVIGILCLIAVILAITIPVKMLVNVDADEIVVTQDPFDGELHFYFEAGMKNQNFGKVTRYKKEDQYWFSNQEDQGDDHDQSIKIRFNDGGHALLSGSVRWKNPLEIVKMKKLHTMYGSQEAIEQALVRTVIEKSVYMTGPLMSSKESYAERRNDLISFISDQAAHGVYRTTSEEKKGIDPLSGKEKTMTVVALIEENNEFLRQEISPLAEHGVSIYNLSINSIGYDGTVEAQIKSQQEAIMNVQTAIAEAKQAEQEAIKAEEQGKANAATAKWKQEVIKAQAVTEAEQVRDVAKLAKEAAAYTKQKDILLGQGEAERKRLVMAADGALEKKLLTYEKVNQYWSDGLAKYQGAIVPSWMSGGNGNANMGGNAFQGFMELVTAKTAKDLGLDMGIKSK